MKANENSFVTAAFITVRATVTQGRRRCRHDAKYDAMPRLLLNKRCTCGSL